MRPVACVHVRFSLVPAHRPCLSSPASPVHLPFMPQAAYGSRMACAAALRCAALRFVRRIDACVAKGTSGSPFCLLQPHGVHLPRSRADDALPRIRHPRVHRWRASCGPPRSQLARDRRGLLHRHDAQVDVHVPRSHAHRLQAHTGAAPPQSHGWTRHRAAVASRTARHSVALCAVRTLHAVAMERTAAQSHGRDAVLDTLRCLNPSPLAPNPT